MVNRHELHSFVALLDKDIALVAIQIQQAQVKDRDLVNFLGRYDRGRIIFDWPLVLNEHLEGPYLALAASSKDVRVRKVCIACHQSRFSGGGSGRVG